MPKHFHRRNRLHCLEAIAYSMTFFSTPNISRKYLFVSAVTTHFRAHFTGSHFRTMLFAFISFLWLNIIALIFIFRQHVVLATFIHKHVAYYGGGLNALNQNFWVTRPGDASPNESVQQKSEHFPYSSKQIHPHPKRVLLKVEPCQRSPAWALKFPDPFVGEG